MTTLPELRPAALAALRHYDRHLPLDAAESAGAGGAPLLGELTDEQVPAGLISPLGCGLINHTFLVDTAALGQNPPVRAVLQRVNPLFGLAVNEDIAAITRHLHARAMPTPLLYPTRGGAPAVTALHASLVGERSRLDVEVDYAAVERRFLAEAGLL